MTIEHLKHNVDPAEIFYGLKAVCFKASSLAELTEKYFVYFNLILLTFFKIVIRDASIFLSDSGFRFYYK